MQKQYTHKQNRQVEPEQYRQIQSLSSNKSQHKLFNQQSSKQIFNIKLPQNQTPCQYIQFLRSPQKFQFQKGLFLLSRQLKKQEWSPPKQIRLSDILNNECCENQYVTFQICLNWISKQSNELTPSDLNSIIKKIGEQNKNKINKSQQDQRIQVIQNQILQWLNSNNKKQLVQILIAGFTNPSAIKHTINVVSKCNNLKQCESIQETIIAWISNGLEHPEICRNILFVLNEFDSEIFNKCIKNNFAHLIKIYISDPNSLQINACLKKIIQKNQLESFKQQINDIILNFQNYSDKALFINLISKWVDSTPNIHHSQWLLQLNQKIEGSSRDKTPQRFMNISSKTQPIPFSKYIQSLENNMSDQKNQQQIQDNTKQLNQNKELIRKNTKNCNDNMKQSRSKEVVPFFKEEDQLSNLKFLQYFRLHRLQRQAIQINSTLSYQDIARRQEQLLSEDIPKIFQKQIARKMLSLDYRKALQAAQTIVQLFKNPKLQSQFKQIYDVVLKWIYFRVFGGCCAQSAIIWLLLPQMMVAFEKCNISLTENQIVTIIMIYRQCLVTQGICKPFDIYNSTLKSLNKLNSGDRTLKILLRQYQVDLRKLHNHLTQQSNIFYRQSLTLVFKGALLNYITSKQTLSQIAQVKQLIQDKEILQYISMNFDEKILSQVKINLPLIKRTTSQTIRSNHHLTLLSSTNIIQEQKQYEIINSQNQFKIQQNTINYLINQIGICQYPTSSDILSKYLKRLPKLDEQTISFLTQLFAQDKYLPSVQKYAKAIFISLFSLILNGFINRCILLPEEAHRQLKLLQLIQSAVKIKLFVSKIQSALQLIIEIIMRQLVFQDENKALLSKANQKYDAKCDDFVRVLNGIILRFLQNAQPAKLLIVLITLLIKQTKLKTPSKMISLITKCISKTHLITGDEPEQTLKTLFIALYRYSTQMQFKQSDPVSNVLKNTLSILSTQLKDRIWYFYEGAFRCNGLTDSFIRKYLESLKISYPQQYKLHSYSTTNLVKVSSPQNQRSGSELRRKIAQMKAKAKNKN